VPTTSPTVGDGWPLALELLDQLRPPGIWVLSIRHGVQAGCRGGWWRGWPGRGLGVGLALHLEHVTLTGSGSPGLAVNHSAAAQRLHHLLRPGRLLAAGSSTSWKGVVGRAGCGSGPWPPRRRWRQSAWLQAGRQGTDVVAADHGGRRGWPRSGSAAGLSGLAPGDGVQPGALDIRRLIHPRWNPLAEQSKQHGRPRRRGVAPAGPSGSLGLGVRERQGQDTWARAPRLLAKLARRVEGGRGDRACISNPMLGGPFRAPVLTEVVVIAANTGVVLTVSW